MTVRDLTDDVMWILQSAPGVDELELMTFLENVVSQVSGGGRG